MNKASRGRFFEDFSLGQIIEHPTASTVSEADSRLYQALTGSRFSLFCNHEYAQKLGFPHQPLDNLLVFHIAFGKTVSDISINAVANLGYAEVQFLEPVFNGDTLQVLSEVIGLKENSNGKTGIVYVHSKVINQAGIMVLSFKRWVMVHKQHHEPLNSYAVVPQLASQVELGHLSLPTGWNSDAYSFALSGENYCLNDYQKGEWIDHIDGITVDNTQHTMATNLYQNNAKVHFNDHQMKASPHQQRLVYGGHVISLCRTISHNGLANGQWLAAIHAGVHANPTYAGDTLYAASQILDCQPLGFGLGALRIRTVGFKNTSWQEFKPVLESFDVDPQSVADNEVSRKRVLDLDYTILIPDL